MRRRIERILLLFMGIAALLLVSGCSSMVDASTPTAFPRVSLDPSLREFYNQRGSEALLGNAISQPFKQQDSICQYTVNVMLCYDPFAPAENRFYFNALGQTLGFAEEPDPAPNPEEGIVVEGFLIPHEFAATYQTLGGQKTLGKPISNARNNYGQQQLEQYFENVGFFHRFDDTSGAVNLLPYGAMACGSHCSTQTALVPPSGSEILTAPSFVTALERLGGRNVFGSPITEPYENGNGEVEQVFENVVVIAPKDNPSAVRFKAITRELGMFAVDPAPRDPTQSGVVFHIVNGNLGYHVPTMFEEFIASHGGMEMSGNPIADTIRYTSDGDVIRQCFENYCLDYHPESAPVYQIRMTPLGRRYQENAPAVTQTTPEPSEKPSLVLNVSEMMAQLPSDKPQQISAFLYDKDTLRPEPGVELKLTIVHPDRKQFVYYMPPTQSDGWTSLMIAAMPQMENGTVVPYTVCTQNVVPETCIQDSFFIWNSP